MLPKEVLAGLHAAQKKDMKRKNRLRVKTDGQIYPILAFRENGFSMELENAPQLRGFVDVYDGAKHLYQCLVVASAEDDGEMFYEFKWAQKPAQAPAADFVRDDNAPVALVTDQR